MNREFVWYEKEADVRTGRTIAVIWDGDWRYVGISECGKRDQFKKKMGRIIALGRARHIKKVYDREIHDRGNESLRNMFGFEVPYDLDRLVLEIPEWMYIERRKDDGKVENKIG